MTNLLFELIHHQTNLADLNLLKTKYFQYFLQEQILYRKEISLRKDIISLRKLTTAMETTQFVLISIYRMVFRKLHNLMHPYEQTSPEENSSNH